jgi:putative addiction module antidote
MMIIKLTPIGNSTGPLLPQKVLERLGVKTGDSIYLAETPDGYELVPCDAEFRRQINIAKKGMPRYRNALRELAK